MAVQALSGAQQEVVEHDGGALRVIGGAGTGKTTALVHRYLRLAAHGGPDRVLVVARDRGAARRFRDAVVPRLHGAWDDLPVTTAWGVAYDLLARTSPGRRPPRLLRAAEQRSLVRSMLGAEAGAAHLWPTLQGMVGRRAFADEVASTVLDARAALLDPDGLRAAAESSGGTPRWRELAGFYQRYLAELEARGLVDSSGVLAQALATLGNADVAAATAQRHRWVLADDHEAADEPARGLVALLAAHGSEVTVAANPDVAVHHPPWHQPTAWGTELGAAAEVHLGQPFRTVPAGSLVRCRHPAMEAEAVAGELLDARRRGVPWESMAVLVRHSLREQAVARALSRHAIPVAHRPGQATEEPTVRGLLDLLRAANGDHAAFDRLLTSPLADLDPAEVRRVRRRALAEGTPLSAQPEVAHLAALRDELAERAAVDDVATLAHRAFRARLSHLVPGPGQVASPEEERALDALVAFLNGLARYVDHHPGTGLSPYLALLAEEAGGDLDPWVPAPAGPGRVVVTSITGAAGQEWDTVVLAGCVEGELPRLGGAVRFFDRALLHGGSVPSVAERRQAALAQERRLFTLARTRARGTFVCTAAPEPGVHVSRFVEGWAARPPRVALGAVSLSPPLEPTPGTAPLWPDESLSLSATQLDTFEDCPLKHAYRYGLGVRGALGVHAALGSLVHAVLARFLDPGQPGERTRQRLLALADECWSDELAPYRPQLEEARRDLYDMLELWWEKEGSRGDGLHVLATERAFTVPVGPHRVTGRIDRLERDEDGGLRVVDYKTGKRRPREADVAEDLQLALYRLAALKDPQMAAWGRPTRVRILHLRSMEAFDQEAGPEQPEATEARVLATADRVLAEEREPAVDADCDHCELHRLCPLWPEGREVGQP